MSLLKKQGKASLLSVLSVLAICVVIGLTGQSKDQDKTQNPGELKPGYSGTATMPDNRVPYVGPQLDQSTPPEFDQNEIFLIPPTQISQEDPRGSAGMTSLGHLDGVVTGKDIWPNGTHSWPPDENIYEHALTSHSNGRLYIAYQAESVNGNDYIAIDYSDDQGLTWGRSGWAYDAVDSTRNFRNPSIAVTDTHIVVAYEVHKGTDDEYIEVAIAPLLNSSSAFTAYSTQHLGAYPEIDPYIWSDLHSYSGSSSVYLIYEQDRTTTDSNILFQRTGTDGNAWKDLSYIMGNLDTYDFDEPHGCWGESNSHYLYVVAYDKTNDTIKLVRSSDWGVTWGAEQSIYTITTEPTYSSVSPTIAASSADGTNAVWINFIKADVTDDDWYYLLALSNPGTTFTGPFGGTNTTEHEQAPRTYMDPVGKAVHMVWTVNREIWYRSANSNMSLWNAAAMKVNRGGSLSYVYYDKGIATDWKFGFPTFTWVDNPGTGGYSTYYQPFSNRLVPDDLVGTWDGQGVYYRTDGGNWIYLASPALHVAAGDLDGAGDGTGDLAGVWGSTLWALKSNTQAWVNVGSAPDDLVIGDMDGGGYGEIVGTWSTQGVYYLNVLGGSTWTYMATPATMIAAGDLDGDGIDDLIGVWPSQAGTWVKYSQTGTWSYIGSTPRHIATGDMDGDGRDDLLGTWDGQGVYWRKSQTGAWNYLGTPATLITSADMDGDGKDDVVGIWPSQAGVWTKYSSTNQWDYLSSTVRDLSSGKMRAGSNTWGAQLANEPMQVFGGLVNAEGALTDYSLNNPTVPGFIFKSEPNTIPVQDPNYPLIPGPGMPGFKCTRTPNPIPVLPPNRDGKTFKDPIRR